MLTTGCDTSLSARQHTAVATVVFQKRVVGRSALNGVRTATAALAAVRPMMNRPVNPKAVLSGTRMTTGRAPRDGLRAFANLL